MVRHGNELYYAMHEHSVLRIAGYVMRYYGSGGRPAPPWSLHLNFNHEHRSFELVPEHFTDDGGNVSRRFREQVEAIDPGWQVPGGEPVFVDAHSKKRLPVGSASAPRDAKNLLREVRARLAEPQRSEVTFFDVMAVVFGGDADGPGPAARLVQCPRCGVRNRVFSSAARTGTPQCGRCGERL